MKLLTKFKLELFILFILAIIYFVLRLPNLTAQPIFADEAIYIRWAQVMRAEPTLRFVSVTDGKTPLFMWLMIPFFKVFSDPLFAGRFLSVLSGFATFFGVFFLSYKVFGRKVAFWATFLYVITPFTVFFDRMALVDSMLSAFSIWSLYFLVWLVQKPALDKAMILGYLLGAGVLTKTPGMMNILLSTIGTIGFIGNREKRGELLKFLSFIGISIFISLAMYNILRLGPEFRQLSARNSDYVFSPLELIGRPLDPFIPHLRDIWDWFPKLLTWPIFIISIAGSILFLLKPKRIGMVVFLWGLLPFLVELTFLRTFTARYVLSLIPILLIFAGFGIQKLTEKFNLEKKWFLIATLFLLLPFYFNFYLITNLAKVPFPEEERKGYLEQWTAGYGFSDIAKYLINERKKGPVLVATQGYFGTLPDGLFIYLDKADVKVSGTNATISAQVRSATKEYKTFFVGHKRQILNNLDKAILIKEYPKITSRDGIEDAIVFYEVLP